MTPRKLNMTSTGAVSNIFSFLDEKNQKNLSLATKEMYTEIEAYHHQKKSMGIDENEDLPVSMNNLPKLFSFLKKSLQNLNEIIQGPQQSKTLQKLVGIKLCDLKNDGIVKLINSSQLNQQLRFLAYTEPHFAKLIIESPKLQRIMELSEAEIRITTKTMRVKNGLSMAASMWKSTMRNPSHPISAMGPALRQVLLPYTHYSFISLAITLSTALFFTLDLIINTALKYSCAAKSAYMGFAVGSHHTTIADRAAQVNDAPNRRIRI